MDSDSSNGPIPPDFKSIHARVQAAKRTAKGWKEFDLQEAKKELGDWIRYLCYHNCIDIHNKRRGEGTCDCLQEASAHMGPRNMISLWTTLVDMAQKPRKEIDLQVIEWIKYAESRKASLVGKPKQQQQRVYLCPGVWEHTVCKHAIAALCGYGRDSWLRLVSAAKSGNFKEHGLVGKPSNFLKKHDHSPKLHQFFKELELYAAPRATRVVRSSLGGEELRDDDLDLVDLPSNFLKNGLYARYCKEVCGTSIKFDSKHRLVSTEAVPGMEMADIPAWSTFRKFWDKNYPKLKIQKPSKDICGECYKHANRFKILAGRRVDDGEDSDEENDEANVSNPRSEAEELQRMLDSESEVKKAAKHVHMAEAQRTLFNRQKLEAIRTRFNEKSERVLTFVCDYAQNMTLPNFGSEQPGETYYYSPLNVYCFGIVDTSSDHLHAMLYLEGEAKKGGDNVASMICAHLKKDGLLLSDNRQEIPTKWQPLKQLNLWFDNCGGQNKNRMVLRLLTFLAERRVASEIQFNFLVAGHTKNDCDRNFNLLKSIYRDSNCFVPSQMIQILNESSQVTAKMTDPSIFFAYSVAQDAVMKPVEGINKHHLFKTKSTEPTKIDMKQYDGCDDDETENISILKRNFKESEWYDTFVSRLNPLQAPGIQTIKWIELHDKWKPLVPRQYWDQFYLYSEDPGPERRQQVKRQLKESKKQRKERVRASTEA